MRLIAADALKEEWIKDTGRAFPADYFIFTIDRSPTIDAAPVVRGEWKIKDEGSHARLVECTACHRTIAVGINVPFNEWSEQKRYCDLCGAKMNDKEGQSMVVQGKWIQHIEPYLDWIKYRQECSECHESVPGVIGPNYCPNCGANMEDKPCG